MTIVIFPAVLASMLLLLLLATAAPSPASPPGCSDELVAFSPCLGYVSAPPNKVTDTETAQCCDAFSKAFNSGDGSPALPPLRGTITSMPPDSGPRDLVSAPSLPPESIDGSPTSPVSPLSTASHSSAEKHNSDRWLLPGVLSIHDSRDILSPITLGGLLDS
ncbi:unnamed protein product [Dovyalis caffra]|uniref:Bifunctional inhibitor/plant lipid transfer protein/seed storage helical domain-containing protein n=1 Tax=Dovyalis caffra TaxID=77055 RepID=A0AAV1QZB7_9ROSI|nr:unnamed protein product [Dovyalis caffra]